MVHSGPKDVPEITSWEVESALGDEELDSTNKRPHINIKTIEALEGEISNIKCLSDRRILPAWKNSDNLEKKEKRKTSRTTD